MTPAAIQLPGAHRVRMRLAGGKRVAIYWYRQRGGPLLMKFVGATMGEALKAEAEGAQALIDAYATPQARPAPGVIRVRDIVSAFKAAPDGYLSLRASTRKTWAPMLDYVIEEFGDLTARALGAKGMRKAVIDWRNRYASTPRSADYRIQVLKRVLSWGMDNEMCDTNPALGVGAIYKNNRADEIVEPQELVAILANLSPAARFAVRLAAATGMRRGDLVDLRWSEVSDFSIERSADKSANGVRLLIPLTQEARAVIAELREINAKAKVTPIHVLTSRKGPWHKDGLTSMFVRAAKKAGVAKSLHDLRGTACTRYVMAGLNDEEIAEWFGWEPERIRRIRVRYVDRERVARGIIARLEKREENG